MNDKATEKAKPEADGSNTEKDKIDDGETENMSEDQETGNEMEDQAVKFELPRVLLAHQHKKVSNHIFHLFFLPHVSPFCIFLCY